MDAGNREVVGRACDILVRGAQEHYSKSILVE